MTEKITTLFKEQKDTTQERIRWISKNSLASDVLKGYGIELVKEDEVYVQIKNHPGYYVSNYGNVFSSYKGALKCQYNSNGYGKVMFQVKDKRYAEGYRTEKYFVHRLVAQAFCPNCWGLPFSEMQVHHKDRNRRNNDYRNLFWVPQSYHGKVEQIETAALFHDGVVERLSIEKLYEKTGIPMSNLLDLTEKDRKGKFKKKPVQAFSSRRANAFTVWEIEDYLIGFLFRTERSQK